jgi:hypothetical protein
MFRGHSCGSSLGQKMNCPNRSIPGHWSKGVFIVYSLFLGELSCYEPCLVLLNTVIYSMFDLVDPLGGHYEFPFSIRTISHTSFFIMDWYSSIMASFQTFWPVASSKLEGSKSMILFIRATYEPIRFKGLLSLRVFWSCMSLQDLHCLSNPSRYRVRRIHWIHTII